MTRRSSVRAHAREIYRELAAETKATTPTPDPSPQGGGEKSLTAQARALYEGSAVPVREIAAIVGVTERTIYKYAAKQRWKQRYARTPEFAPAKGAGGRFIAREDKGKPCAQGLKATGPAGATRAQASCRQAEGLSREAQAEAEREQRAQACIQAMEWISRVLAELRGYLEARDAQRPEGPAPDNDPVEHAYQLSLTLAVKRWEALQAEEAAALAA